MAESDPDPARTLDERFLTKARAEILAWRKAERERLIALRLSLSADVRADFSEKIADGLDEVLGEVAGKTVSLYWPFRGEPDLRPWISRVIERGGTVALPLVVAKATPLAFRAYRPGDRLERGVWNIPIPADGPEAVPDIAIAPVVGFDRQSYRLGYGGGFFDRTLAALSPRPCVIGVGYDLQRIETIRPLAHDIPMTAIVTERGAVTGAP